MQEVIKNEKLSSEEWLNNATKNIRNLFWEKGIIVPENIMVSCGFAPTANFLKVKGVCFDKKCSSGDFYEIFFSPVIIGDMREEEIISVLIHEIVHVVVGVEKKHGKDFRKVATKVGLEGKMRSTVASERLMAKIIPIAECLGKYPHPPMIFDKKDRKERKKNIIKAKCEQCDYEIKVKECFWGRGSPQCRNCGLFFVKIDDE